MVCPRWGFDVPKEEPDAFAAPNPGTGWSTSLGSGSLTANSILSSSRLQPLRSGRFAATDHFKRARVGFWSPKDLGWNYVTSLSLSFPIYMTELIAPASGGAWTTLSLLLSVA